MEAGKEVSEHAAHTIDEKVRKAVFGTGSKPIVDWETKDAITGKLIIEIGDYLIDEVRDKYDLDLTYSQLDELAVKILEVAKKRYKS